MKQETKKAADMAEKLDIEASEVAIRVAERNNIHLLGSIKFKSRRSWEGGAATPLEPSSDGQGSKPKPEEGGILADGSRLTVPSGSLFTHSCRHPNGLTVDQYGNASPSIRQPSR